MPLNIRKKAVRAAAAATVAVMLLSGCGRNYDELRGKFTFNGVLGIINTFSPTEYKTTDEESIYSFLSTQLWAEVMNAEKTGHETICMAAADFPEDATAEFAGTGKFGIPDDADAGYVWRIKIRDDMVWDDGTPITSADYTYSLKQCLDPGIMSYRASDYFENMVAIRGARDYNSCTDGSLTFDDVGFIAEDDYTLLCFTAIPVADSSTFACMFDCKLVKPDMFEQRKKQSGEIIKSDYGTNADNMPSYGPFRILSYQESKEIHLVRNDNWFGYKDPRFRNKYMTTDIVLSYIPDANTRLSSFLQGELSTVSLNVDQLDQYGTSDYVIYTPNTTTYEIALNTDFDMLKSREKKGENKTILCYKDFRKAMSFAMNRQDFINQCLGIGNPAFGIISKGYLCNIKTGDSYRDLPEAAELLQEVYEDYDDSVSGYYPEKATELLRSAYEQCSADGNIKPDDVVSLELHVRTATTTSQKQGEFIEESLLEAAVGTPLEGRIKIKVVANPDYFNSATSGRTDLIFAGWSGGLYDPYSLMVVYTDPAYILEYGFDTDAAVDFEINGETVTKSYFEWYKELNSGEYATASRDIRNHILCQLEKNLLLNFHAIPMYNALNPSLRSQRMHYESETYVDDIIGFGDISGTTYTMDDAAWARYCDEHRLNMGY